MRSRGSRNTSVRGDRPSSALSRTARIASYDTGSPFTLQGTSPALTKPRSGDVGATVAETMRVNEAVRAALAGPEGVAAVGATLTRALPASLDRRVRVRLAPPPPFFRNRVVLVAAAAAAVAAVAVVRSRRTTGV